MIHEIVEATSFIFLLIWLMSLSSKFWITPNINKQIVSGIAFGLIAIISMINPVTLSSGVLLDARLIVISVGTFFGGLATGLIATLIAGAYRLHIGGTAAPAGIFLMFVAWIISWQAARIVINIQRKYQWLVYLVLSYVIYIGVIFVVKETQLINYSEQFTFLITTLLIMPIGSFLVFILIDQSIRKDKDKRNLQISQERLLGISEAIPDLLIILDEDGKYLEIFGSDQSLLVAPKEELIGKSLKDVLPSEKADFFLIWIKSVINENATKETEYSLDTLAGLKYFEARASAMKATYHDKRAVALMTRDITKYKMPSSVTPAEI